MCGIAGAIGPPARGDQVRRLLARLAHRGPDGSGVQVADSRALGMCRLRIRDDTDVPLPLHLGAVDEWVAYNGEVYRSSGRSVPATAEEEVRSLFSAGPMIGPVDGMYAYARLPAAPAEIELGRDPFGIKPLYLLRPPEGGILFASEIQALLAVMGTPAIEEGAVGEFLAYGRVLGDRTFFQGILSLGPGQTVRLHADGGQSVWQQHPPLAGSPGSPAELRAAVRDAVMGCLPSSRPLGLAVSGGLDSSIIATELSEAGFDELTTVSVVPEGSDDGIEQLESLQLAPGGAWRGWRHSSLVVGPSPFVQALQRVTAILGQPTRLTSAPLCLLLAERFSELGRTVVLTGEGADELFAGYDSYRTWNQGPSSRRVLDFVLPPARRRWLKELLGEPALEACEGAFFRAYPGAGQTEIQALLDVERTLSLEPLLIRTDHTLMSYALEGRTPFLHGEVPGLASSWPAMALLDAAQGKLPLRDAYRNLLPRQSQEHKRPFRAPIWAWFQGVLAPWLRRTLLSYRDVLATLQVRPDGVEALAAAAIAGDPEACGLAYGLVSLAYWRESTTGGTP
jgi:asparagine synthase (glutamine-hydrolysing)